MGLWGQRVKIGGLNFMSYKMGSSFCNYDLRYGSDLEFLKEISSSLGFQLLLITMNLCGQPFKYLSHIELEKK